MNARRTPVNGLASAGISALRYGLAGNLLWIGALKFQDYEVSNIEPLVSTVAEALRADRAAWR
ncbi:hypothetical protein ACQP1W_45320 [Spirillospora sp. CA-255316]